MFKSDYVYPDANDAATIAMLTKENSWEQDEKEILAYAKSFIQKGKIFIDAGCGFGRLIPVFAPYFEKVIAVEPDLQRIQIAKETIDLAGLSKKVEFVHLPIEEMTIKNKVDVILSSHIIQHISTTVVLVVLQKIRYMLKTGGLLILTTSNSPREDDRFIQGFLRNGKNIEEEIQKTKFEHLIGNTDGVLPVRQYSSQSLVDLLEQTGFTVVARRLFHTSASYPKGRDVLVIAK